MDESKLAKQVSGNLKEEVARYNDICQDSDRSSLLRCQALMSRRVRQGPTNRHCPFHQILGYHHGEGVGNILDELGG